MLADFLLVEIHLRKESPLKSFSPNSATSWRPILHDLEFLCSYTPIMLSAVFLKLFRVMLTTTVV